ncbi:hypothetical protein [Enterococcus faecalis]|uniref:hypothetical protein n=1 Tax=Enterococcus faecalis TaxID=1351 RepID=UPI00338DB202
MENNILILISLALYFLIGYTVGIRKYHKKINAAIDYELKLPTSDYQKGWLDCLGFILKQ